MIIELGHFALILAFLLSLVQTIVPLIGLRTSNTNLILLSHRTSFAILFFTIFSFSSLVYSYAVSDFSIINVWQNSHSRMPLLFKLTGSWGNHEGSMLLWVLILSIFTALVALANLPRALKVKILSIQSLLLFVFFAFILFTSNPFLRQPLLLEGQDLNPILQDIGLAIHPPMLYLGYVGFSVTFAFALAALHEGKLDKSWATWVRPWALLAWMFLTAGIALGSYWAYYELGWGGWWFWDPVENASFLPWLSGTAFLHSALVLEKRGGLRIWTILLAILTFSLSLLGTFLVRSGILTSVHSFASDPSRGIFILLILCLFIGGALVLFSTRSHHLAASKDTGLFVPLIA